MTKMQCFVYLIFPIVLVTAIVLSAFLSCAVNTPSAAVIVPSDVNFDKTDIMDDLADIDLDKFIFEQSLSVEPEHESDPVIFEFVEYCYSDSTSKNYGLYLYLYNPGKIDISIVRDDNVINMVTDGYVMDKSQPNAGTAGHSSYHNVGLTYLDSTTGEYERLFYKFKVTDVSKIYETEKEYNATFGKRRYDIASIQIRPYGSFTSDKTDYKVGGIWNYSGYAYGYDESAKDESTLSVTREDLTTLELDVKHTFYRPKGWNTEDVAGLQDQLDSVYFSIPNDYLTVYGDIAGIYATWDERRTQPMLVIGDVRYENGEWSDFGKACQEFKRLIGQDISTLYDDKNGWSSSQVNYSFAAGMYSTQGLYPWLTVINPIAGLIDTLVVINNFTAAACYNMQTKWVDPQPNRLSTIYNVFDVAGEVNDYTVSGGEIIEWWEKYTANHPSSDKICGYSSELFTDRVNLKKDLGRVAGRQEMYVPANGDIKLESHTLDRGFWSVFWGTHPWESSSYSTEKAIEVMKDGAGYNYDSILKYKEAEARSFCQQNLMDYSTFSDFQKTVQTAKDKDESVVMFRFAQTEYNSLPVALYNYKDSGNWMNYMKDSNGENYNAYLCTENVFLDFDILSLTFCKDGVYNTIPVVANPIDAVGGLTPPPINRGDNCSGALFTILMCIALVIFVVLIAKVIGWVSKTFRKMKTNTNVTINMPDMSEHYDKDKKNKNKKE